MGPGVAKLCGPLLTSTTLPRQAESALMTELEERILVSSQSQQVSEGDASESQPDADVESVGAEPQGEDARPQMSR